MMKNVLIKTVLFCTPFVLIACSMLTDNDSNAPKRPVTVENAQESIQQAPQQQMPAPAQAPPNDQNTLQKVNLSAAPSSSEPIGGSIEKSMEKDDKIKMSRALDKSPGKTTSWTNNRNSMHYAVTPIRKIVLKDNPFCRTYQMTATRGSYTKEVSGTACVSDDGNWHPI
jgi:surface antigen